MYTRHGTLIEFNPLSKVNKSGNKLQCNLFVGVVKKSCNPELFTAYQLATVQELITNPELIPITDSFFDSFSGVSTATSMDLAAFIVTDSCMISKKTNNPNSRKFSTMTFITSGKNLGKANATNAFTQALAEAASKWTKKRDEWQSIRVAPMLANGVGYDAKEIVGYIDKLVTKYERFAIQYKLDGERVIAGNNEAYSRTKKDVLILPEMQKEINAISSQLSLQSGYNVFLDGELYVHGLPLAIIQGLVSTAKATSKGHNKSELEYHVFDVIPLDERGNIAPLTYDQRITLLNTVKETKFVKAVPVLLKNGTTNQILAVYETATKNGYEGLMFKPLDEVYAAGSRTSVMKLKPVIRDEFTLVGFHEGAGKNLGKIVFVAKLCPSSIQNAIAHLTAIGRTYNPNFDPEATFQFVPKFPGQTTQAHNDEFTKMRRIEPNGKSHFENHAKGKPYTVEFLDYSEDLKPLRLKGIGLRDPAKND